MKTKLIALALLITTFSSAQILTAIPDNNFENYLETHNTNGNIVSIGDSTSMGNGVANDNKVYTSRISSVTSLVVQSLNITDLTGIHAFSNLSVLSCGNNQMTNLDLSQNSLLTMFACNNNQLTSLNLKNGNNTSIIFLNTTNNPNLACIEVDNAIWSTANWSGFVDATTLFSENCSAPTETHVPNDNFENYLETHDANGNIVSLGDATSMGNGITNDNYVFTSQIIGVSNLDISSQNISDLTGIEDFNSLTNLNCSDNQLTYLYIGGNLFLTELNCSENQLTGIYIASNTALTRLDCSNNSIGSTLYTLQNTALTYLNCANNLLISLDVSQNTALLTLSCSNNAFTSNLDVSTNTALKFLNCSNNNLTNLNITQNLYLINLYCHNNNLTNLDVTQNTVLLKLHCNNNNLGNLDVTQNTALWVFDIGNNNLLHIDITQNTNLSFFYCQNNQLGMIGSNLDLTYNTSLEYFWCFGNSLSDLDVSNNINLKHLKCSHNNLTSLDISPHTYLTVLDCRNNQLTSLNMKNGNNTNVINSNFKTTNNPNLICIEVDDTAWSTTNWTNIDSAASFSQDCLSNGETYVPDNNFENYLETHNATGGTVSIGDATSMGNGIANDNYVTTNNINTVLELHIANKSIGTLTGIEDFHDLQLLNCGTNQLTNLDLTQNTALTFLSCAINQITDLNLTQNLALEMLFCHSNNIQNLDITQNTALTFVRCRYNNIQNSLDITQNTALVTLECNNNQITNLDTTQNTALEQLHCFNNLLTNIDLSQNANLISFTVNNNHLNSLDITQNTALTRLDCSNNLLTSLNVKNGNNTNFSLFKATNNTNLACIEVDDAVYSTTNWTLIDPGASFNENCSCTGTVTEFNSMSWSNGFPTPTSVVVINDMYQVDQEGSFEACSCEIKQNGYLKIEPNTYVKLNQNLKNNGTIEVMNQGSFVQVNNNANIIGNGTFTTAVQTTQLDDPSRFTYFSSPVQNQDLTVFSSWARMNRLWRFNESIQDWYLVNQNDLMIPAVGYAIQGDVNTGQYPFTGQVNFNGAFNNGIFSYPLTYNAGGIDNDNTLVGNPYPSAIDAALLLSTNTNANAFYFWTHKSIILPDGSNYAGDDYAIWNSSGGIASTSGSPAPNGYIASGQGFFVEASGTGNLIFNNSMRVTDNNTDFRKPVNINRDRIWLNLSNNEGYFNQILINFSENGTINFDNKLDAVRLDSGNAISFYSNGLNSEFFAIQAVPNLSSDNSIPLRYDVNSTTISNLTISIDHLDFQNNTNVYIKDNLLNIIHNLNQSNYQFNVEQGQFNNRFELIISRSLLNTKDNSLNTENLIVNNSTESKINVKTLNGSIVKNLKVYDIIGKLIINIEPNKNDFIINTNVEQGTVLFIFSKLENGQIINTKFIKL